MVGNSRGSFLLTFYQLAASPANTLPPPVSQDTLAGSSEAAQPPRLVPALMQGSACDSPWLRCEEPRPVLLQSSGGQGLLFSAAAAPCPSQGLARSWGAVATP